MNPALAAEVTQALSEIVGRSVRIVRESAATGGCINSGARLALDDGSNFFVKHNASAPDGFFEAEASGLVALAAATSIRLPKPIASGGGEDGLPAYLLLEYIASSPAAPDYDERFGRGLAELHRASAASFGADEDNFIGSTQQVNPRAASWPDFFAEARLAPMLAKVESRGRTTPELHERMERLFARLPELIGRHNPIPSLIHGDLWSGNVMTGPEGEPVLIDPAAHYADREADLAMTELFGRFAPEFYAAYREAWPLPAGYEVRRDLYNLYHLLNHVYLFGLSYMGGAMAALRRYT